MEFIEKEFFARPIHEVAQDLLGRDLLRGKGEEGEESRGRIVEVEVYEGANDGASHARSGIPTGRTWPMFEAPGTIYVYKIYGRYYCLNFRAGEGEAPGAILIRACEPLQGKAEMAVRRGLTASVDDYREGLARRLMRGPAMLTQALGIDGEFNGEMIGQGLRLGEGEPLGEASIRRTERIGLNRKTCGECVDRKWRYLIAGSPWVSR